MTNKLKLVASLLIVLFLMCSCFFKNNVMVNIGNKTDEITLAYDKLALQILASDKFTPEEIKELWLIDSKAKFIIKEFRSLKTQSDVTGDDMYNLYKRVKVLYVEASDLIKTRYDILPEKIQLLLYKFDYAATSLDRKVETAAVDSEKRKQALQDIQEFTFSIFKLLIPVLLV